MSALMASVSEREQGLSAKRSKLLVGCRQEGAHPHDLGIF